MRKRRQVIQAPIASAVAMLSCFAAASLEAQLAGRIRPRPTRPGSPTVGPT